MYKLLKLNDFRQFKNMNILLGKNITVLAGRNSTGKSTILGVLANSGELKKKDGTTYSNRRFRAEFSEIFHGSKKYDASGSDRIQIDIVDENDNIIDYRKFRTAWQNEKGKDRFRVIPIKFLDGGKKTEAKMQIPVSYLGLSRLFPIGEANEEKIVKNKINFMDDKQKNWFIEQYKQILSLYDTVTDISNYSIGETDKKKGVGIETDKYDYLTNSSGQDNLGQILMAILSFKRLKLQREDWTGGLLLIDEIDATLHPAAQKRLIDLLIKEAKINNIQVVVTTHSSDLLKHICNKTAHNSDSKNNNVELYYFTNGNRHLEMRRNPEYSTIENDLLVESMLQNANKVKIYSEDAENRWFIKKLVPEYLPYVDMLDVKIGCDQLLSLYTGDVIHYLMANPAERLDMHEASQRCGLSYYAFSRFFHEMTGMGYAEYGNLIRIRHTEELLIYSDMSVEEISRAVGMSSANYYTRLFKKVNGMSPTKYRSVYGKRQY